jgi:hypothetical protein
MNGESVAIWQLPFPFPRVPVFRWSNSAGTATAKNYMSVDRAFESKSLNIGDFSVLTTTALYALAAPDVPQQARDEAIDRAQSGEHITKTEADNTVADAISSP